MKHKRKNEERRMMREGDGGAEGRRTSYLARWISPLVEVVEEGVYLLGGCQGIGDRPAGDLLGVFSEHPSQLYE
eukprot:745648-Hanusia_phi.AAC.1